MLADVPGTPIRGVPRGRNGKRGERYLGNTGRVEWLVSFAPIAPAELRAFIQRESRPPH